MKNKLHQYTDVDDDFWIPNPSIAATERHRRFQSNCGVTLIGSNAVKCGTDSNIYCLLFTVMDSFDNFQYDSASSYGGGMGIVDDNSSVYTANTNNHTSVDLESLSISDSLSQSASTNADESQNHYLQHGRAGMDEDFDAVLDDLKDDGVVDLPPHACR